MSWQDFVDQVGTMGYWIELSDVGKRKPVNFYLKNVRSYHYLAVLKVLMEELPDLPADENKLDMAAIIGHDGSIWARTDSFPEVGSKAPCTRAHFPF